MNFRSYYSAGKSKGQVFSKPSLTQQHSKNECDINAIIAKYRSTGIISHVTGARPLFGDFTAVGNFQDVQAKVLFADQAFAQLPSPVRRRFNNDPAEFMAFVQNPANQAEAEKLGLISKPAPAGVEGTKAADSVDSKAAAVTPTSTVPS